LKNIKILLTSSWAFDILLERLFCMQRKRLGEKQAKSTMGREIAGTTW